MRAAKLIAILSGVHPVVRWNAASGVLPAWLTLARASTATYFDANGILQTAAINAPRFDHDPATLAARGLLFEEQRTNLLLKSFDLSSAPWVSTGLTSRVLSTIAPDASGLWTICTENTSTNVHEVHGTNFSAGAGLSYTASVFVKAGTRRYVSIRGENTTGSTTYSWVTLDTQNGSIVSNSSVASSSVLSLGNGIFRVSLSWIEFTTVGLNIVIAGSNVSTAPEASSVLGNSYTGNSSTIYVWGAQVEFGAFSTSYIPTTSAAVTRSADVPSVPSVSLTGPTILESTDIATGVTSRTAYAAGAFAWPSNIWARALAIYARGTPMSYVNAHLLVGGPF